MSQPLWTPSPARVSASNLNRFMRYVNESCGLELEDYDALYTHGSYGLQPLNHGMQNQLRLEREALYVDNGAIKVMWRDIVQPSDISGRKVGHIVMDPWDSWQIKSPNEPVTLR